MRPPSLRGYSEIGEGFRNWKGSCRSLSNFLGAYGTDAQGEVEGTGLVYSCEEEAKGQFNSNLQLLEEELKGDGLKPFSIVLHGKTRENGLQGPTRLLRLG